jgi:ABC-type enterochelin transport system ATPase subunit
VTRSLRQFGIWPSSRDQPTDEEALAVNHAIRQMVLKTGELTPARLRRIDIELMALSRYGVTPL